MTQTALVVGASGIVGSAITQLLLDQQWQVAALSRRPSQVPGVIPVAADLQDPASLQQARQQLWATTTPAAANQAFNVTNGDVFRWKWMWGDQAFFEVFDQLRAARLIP